MTPSIAPEVPAFPALGMRVIGRFGRRAEGWESAAALSDEVPFEVE